MVSLFNGVKEEAVISDESLAEIIEIGRNSKDKKLLATLFIADDFTKFKELMVKRNKAL